MITNRLHKVNASQRAAKAYIDRFGLRPEEAGGLRVIAFARSTGTLVGVYNSVEAGLDNWGWATVCEDHERLVLHDSLALAKSHAADPEGWCGICNGAEVSR